MKFKNIVYSITAMTILGSCATFFNSKTAGKKPVVYERMQRSTKENCLCKSCIEVNDNDKPKTSINEICVIRTDSNNLEERVEYQKPAVKKINIEKYITTKKIKLEKYISNDNDFSKEDLKNLVKNIALKYNVDPAFALAISDAESDFNPYSISRAGAVGIMQLMPETARGYNLDVPYYKKGECTKKDKESCKFAPEIDERFDPESNVTAGVSYLHDLKIGLGKQGYNSFEDIAGGYIMGGRNYLERMNSGRPLSTEVINYIKEVMENYRNYKETI